MRAAFVMWCRRLPPTENRPTVHVGLTSERHREARRLVRARPDRLERSPVRARIFVTSTDDFDAAGAVHGERFGGILPVTSNIAATALLR